MESLVNIYKKMEKKVRFGVVVRLCNFESERRLDRSFALTRSVLN